MRPWGHRLVSKSHSKNWIKAQTCKITVKLEKLFWSRIPLFLPPLPLNPISISLWCCCGCCNILSPLANYCPNRTCDLRQEEFCRRGSGLLSAASVFFAQFDVPWPSEMDDIRTVALLNSSTMWVKGRQRGFFYSVPVSGGSVFLISPSTAYLKLLLFPLRARLYPLISSAYR